MIKILKTLLLATLLIIFTLSFANAETVKIIGEDAWYPYSGKTDKGLEGIAVDIVQAAFAAEGITAEFEVMNYDRGMQAVKDGNYIGCFDAPRTKEIENDYLWHSEPMFSGNSYFYAATDFTGTFSGIADLAGHKLGLTQGYGYGDSIDLNQNIEKEYSKSDETIINKLIAKRVEFIILYDRVADYLMSKLKLQGKIKPVGPSESTDLYVAFSKSNPEGKKYCDIFSNGLQKIKSNGTYQKIFSEWDARLKGGSAPADVK